MSKMGDGMDIMENGVYLRSGFRIVPVGASAHPILQSALCDPSQPSYATLDSQGANCSPTQDEDQVSSNGSSVAESVSGLKVLSDEAVRECPDLLKGCTIGQMDVNTPCQRKNYEGCPVYSGGQK